MKRDNDFIRNMLFEAEADKVHLFLATLTMGADQESLKRHYHAELLCDADLFVSKNSGVYRMTSQGHDYLDAIRDDTVWNKTKDGAKELGGATIAMMADIAVAYLKQTAKEKLGIDL